MLLNLSILRPLKASGNTQDIRSRSLYAAVHNRLDNQVYNKYDAIYNLRLVEVWESNSTSTCFCTMLHVYVLKIRYKIKGSVVYRSNFFILQEHFPYYVF